MRYSDKFTFLIKVIIVNILTSLSIFINAQNLSMGKYNVIYICPDSTLSAIGYNHDYELGDGTNINRSIPVKVKGLHNVVAVNSWGSLALLADGTVWQWKRRLPSSEGIYSLNKIKIDSVIAINAGSQDLGGNFYTAIRKDGTLWMWGEKSKRDTSIGGYTDSIIKVDFPNKVIKTACGENSIIVLCEDSSVWTWYPKIGLNINTPQKSSSLKNIVDIALGDVFPTFWALQNDGTVWVWGHYNGSLVPLKMGLSNVKALYAGVNPIGCNFYALKYDGSLWFYNLNLGQKIPQIISGIKKIKYVSSTGWMYNSVSTFLEDSLGNKWRWGNNTFGELGNSTTFSIDSPEIMPHPCVAVDCNAITKNPELLKLDTFVYCGVPVKLKSTVSDADLYWWYPQSNILSGKYSQEAIVKIKDSTKFVAVLMDSYGCMRKEDFILRKKCNPGKLVFDTISYSGAIIRLKADTGNNYSWSPIDNLDCYFECRQTTVNIIGPIKYVVTYTDTLNCLQNDTFNIRIQECKGKDTLMLDSLIVPGSNIKLTSFGAESNKWSPVDGLSCINCPSPIAKIYKNTEYVDSITDKYNCKWVERFKLTNNCDTNTFADPPKILDSITYPQVKINVNINNAFFWQPFNGLSCYNCPNPVITITDSIIYIVSIKDSFSCVSKSKLIFRLRNCDAVVKQNNIIRLDTVIHFTTDIPLNSLFSYNGYNWIPTSGLSCTDCQNPILKARESMNYLVETYDQLRCKINEIFKVTMNKMDVVIPNVFTPNDDHINDYFEIKGLVPRSILRIYDSNGKLIFIDENYHGQWNGYDNNGNKLEEGTYWYTLQVPESGAFKGWVYLKR